MKYLFTGITSHKKYHTNIGFSILMLLLSTSVYSQELSLDKFVETILKNNPGVQRILIEDEISTASRDASLGINDPTLASSLSLAHAEPNKIYGFEPTTSNNTNLNLSYNQIFSDSGTRLLLNYNSLYTEQDPAAKASGTQYYQPSFTVKLTQPLLKNKGGIQDRLNINLSELNLKLTKLNSKELLESYITQLAALYIDWYLASQEVSISKEVYRQAIEQEKLTRTKVKRQVSEPYELLHAQEIREDYFSRWQQALGRFAGLTKKIKYQLNASDDVKDFNLVPTDPKNAALMLSEKDILRKNNYLVTLSRLKSILNTIKQQQTILVDAKNNARSSDLNLSLGYTRHGINSSFSDAHNSSLNKDDYSIMLEYKYPLGNHKADSNFRSQLAQKRKISYDIKQKLIDANANLENLEAQSTQLEVAIKSVNRKINFSRKKLKKEQRLYRIGKLDLFQLLKDQTTQLESRLNRERLHAQKFNLKLKIGELLDRNLETYQSTLDLINSKDNKENQ